MKFKLKKIKSDASFREFYRLHKGKKTSIIVTAKKEKFNVNFTGFAQNDIHEFINFILEIMESEHESFFKKITMVPITQLLRIQKENKYRKPRKVSALFHYL